MTENSTSKYLPGTCYTCQKCLRCFQSPEDLCNCQKDSKLSRVKNPLRGQQIYQCAFTPNQQFPSLNQFLLDADTKFAYNSNFKEHFSYTTCSSCNSKLQRLKDSDRKSQHKKIQKLKKSKSSNRKVQNDEVIVLDSLPNGNNKKRARDHSTIRKRNKGNHDDKTSNDEIDEMKIQLVVKDKDIKTPTAKIIAIQPVSYKNVIEKINLTTSKILGKKFKSNDDYIISYKVMNARGPSNTLEDKLDFQEFISEYRKVISSGKKMLVMVTVKDNIIKKKNRKYKMVRFLYIYYYE